MGKWGLENTMELFTGSMVKKKTNRYFKNQNKQYT